LHAPVPENEADRLAALRGYDALDQAPEPSFDRLARLAALLFSTPIALITLLDADRQVFKSHYGTDLRETSRDESFCAHAIHASGVTVVCDATLDTRFADNPLVLGPPHIRFYAGAPLETQKGFRLGAICVIDSEPRQPPDPQRLAALRDLADSVVELLEFQCARRELEENRRLWRKTEQRATMALEAGQMGYWERDADSDLVTLSPALEEMLGIEHGEYDGTMDGWMKRIHPDDRALIPGHIEEARRTGQSYTFKYRALAADGTERWITTTGAYKADEAGKFAGAQGVSWDSTAFDVAARELKLSEELFRGLSASAPVGVFRFDADCNCTYANSKWAETLAMTEPELLGQGWLTRVHPGDRDALRASLQESLASHNSWTYEHRLLLPDASVRWVNARLAILRDDNGRVMAMTGTMDDITERQRTIQDLRAAKDAAEVANSAKDIFLANVSHELRTPLNGILGMNHLLLESGLTADQLEMAQIIQQSAQGLLTVVNEVLDLRAIETGQLSVEPMPFNLRKMIRQAIALFEADAREKGVKLLTHYPAQLAESYLGDESRIKQILIHYLSNAVKFAAVGKITVAAGEEANDGGPDVRLEVSDTGPGIELEAQARLFRPFSQVDDSRTRRTGGIGLGLAISKRLAELMGGCVGLSSAPGMGSTFWVQLPLKAASRPSDPDRPEACRAAAKAKKELGRVLLVEDDPVNQKAAALILRGLGWQTDIADNGLAAVNLFQKNDYAMVLMDCQMPEMDGYAATRQIRHWESLEGRPNVPILALTAHALIGDRERCLEAGMSDYLAKPFGLDELRRVLNHWAAVRA
jgi:PAS domain S-box-containing protein